MERKLNKLLKETKLKLGKCNQEIGVILIDFANAYNKIWKESELTKIANNSQNPLGEVSKSGAVASNSRVRSIDNEGFESPSDTLRGCGGKE